jgi:hypothetical protein
MQIAQSPIRLGQDGQPQRALGNRDIDPWRSSVKGPTLYLQNARFRVSNNINCCEEPWCLTSLGRLRQASAMETHAESFSGHLTALPDSSSFLGQILEKVSLYDGIHLLVALNLIDFDF